MKDINDKIIIRQEQTQDYDEVIEVIRLAFLGLAISSQTEHEIVDRLRRSDAFVPELSLVAVLSGKIIGHILLSKVKIKNDSEGHTVLSLAPVSILPEFQKQGIGGALIHHAHNLAAEKGFGSCVLIGHASYYPRFGYVQAKEHDITFPFDVKQENSMVKELIEDGLQGVNGCVEYPKEFFE